MDRDKRLKLRRWRRKQRVRAKIFGTPDKPRLSVFRSNKHIYAQVIDDIKARTLICAGTLDTELMDKFKDKPLGEKAREVGLVLAKRCLEKDIKEVVFDKNRFSYHGNIKKLAEGAREGGLQF